MDRITGANAIDLGSGRRGFRDRNTALGIAGTRVLADWLNAIQEEIMAVIEAAGLTADASDMGQLLKALGFTTHSLGASVGYQKLPGGLIAQWGKGQTTASDGGIAHPVIFPIAFPTSSLSIVATEQNAVGWGTAPTPEPTIFGVQSPDRFGFQLYAARIRSSGGVQYQSGLSFNWIGFGF
ncbi:MAG: hypothetical protein E7K72_02275 [Roseomonas mucosa]|nr:hypothetical protein [Roseomonas mucosa]